MTTMARAPALPPPSRGAFRLAVAALVAAVLAVGLGGMVTSTGSGMAFPDWPLAWGAVWPEGMSLDGYLEHIHRFAGMAVGLLTVSLVVVCRRGRPGLRRLLAAVLGVVVVQGLLGGLGVLNELPVANSVAHGVLAQVTLGLIALVAFALSDGQEQRIEVPAAPARTSRRLTAIALGGLFVQLLLGAIVRHATGGDRTLALWSHVGLAFFVAGILLVAAAHAGGRFAAARAVGTSSRWVIGLLLLQLVLGFAALAVTAEKHADNIRALGESMVRTGHQLTGALLLMATVLLTARIHRTLTPARREEP